MIRMGDFGFYGGFNFLRGGWVYGGHHGEKTQNRETGILKSGNNWTGD